MKIEVKIQMAFRSTLSDADRGDAIAYIFRNIAERLHRGGLKNDDKGIAELRDSYGQVVGLFIAKEE